VTSCISSSEQTHSNPNEVRDVGCFRQAIDLTSQLPRYPSYEWVDPRVLDIPTHFRGPSNTYGFLSKVSMLKPDSPSDVIVADSCDYIDQVCHGRENGPHDFFFVYTCLFNDLHVTLPFD